MECLATARSALWSKVVSVASPFVVSWLEQKADLSGRSESTGQCYACTPLLAPEAGTRQVNIGVKSASISKAGDVAIVSGAVDSMDPVVLFYFRMTNVSCASLHEMHNCRISSALRTVLPFSNSFVLRV